MKTVKVLIADYSEDLTDFPETPADLPVYQKKTKFIETVSTSDKLFDLLTEMDQERKEYWSEKHIEVSLDTKEREFKVVQAYFKLHDLDVRTARRLCTDNELYYFFLILN